MSTRSIKPKEPTASAVSLLSEAPLYDVAKKAHEEKQAAFQAVQERAAGPLGLIHKWKRCTGCGHPQHPKKCRELTTSGTPDGVDECGCLDLIASASIAMRCADAGGCTEHPASTPDEPPLTPEEEEILPPAEGPEYTPCVTCGHIEPEHSATGQGCDYCEDCPQYRTEPDFVLPPQPRKHRLTEAGERLMANVIQRRPPYAVAYSVDGHLFEVALPGDATVTAVDGALVIKHGAGQVAGIVAIQPIDTKEND